MGAPVTDWVSYTPSLSWVSNATASALWRRVGDSLEVTGRVLTSGAPTSAELNISLPSGLSIDTAKLVSTTRLDAIGEARVRDDDAAAVYDGFLRYVSTTAVAVLAQITSGSSNSVVNATTPFTWAANDTVTFEFRVPIVGWSSSTMVSSSADTRVVAAQITGTPTSSLTGSYSTATWTSGAVVVDTHGAFDAATGTYTAPVPGLYKIEGCVEIARSSGSTTQAAAWRVTNVTQSVTRVAGGNTWVSSGSEILSMSGSTLIRANGGDQIRIQAYSAGSGTAYNADFTGTNISINLLQGPSQIQASEVIAMQANTCSNTVTGLTALVFSAKNFDTHNSYNTSTGIYTVPAPGLYEVDFTVHTNSASWTAGQVVICYIYKNGSPVGDFRDVRPATSTTQTKQNGTMLVQCNAGDTLAIRSDASITYTADGSALRNFFAVKRLGGV